MHMAYEMAGLEEASAPWHCCQSGETAGACLHQG